MNKTGLAAAVAARLPQSSRHAAAEAVSAVFEEIQAAVAGGQKVIITGFGTFESVYRLPHTGRNPSTGQAIEVAGSTAPRFRPGAGFRAAVSSAAQVTT